MGDQKRVVVDTFSRYRIVNPILFFKTVRNEAGAQGRLAALITGNLRSILGASTLGELLSANRVAVMHKIKDQVNIAAKGLGIELVDVRICRADLPQENSQAIFERMISERVKEAKQLSAEGRMKSQIIRSNADLTCTTIVATGQQEAETIKGEGDKKAQEITRKAYAVDPEFAAFYQTLQGYEKALDAQTSYVLSSDNVFLRYFNVNKSVTRGD